MWSSSVWIGEKRTNNEAEYRGLIEGLIGAEKLGIKVRQTPIRILMLGCTALVFLVARDM